MEDSALSQMFSGARKFSIAGSPTFNNANIINIYNERGVGMQSEQDAPAGYQEGISLCPSSTDFFTGRVDILEAMESYFVKGPMSLDKKQRKVFVLHGLGGAGKTQCALEFIRRCQDKFSKIYFIHSSSEHLIKASYYDIAKENKVIKPTWEAGRDWLQTYKEEWMVLFDNVDDPDLQLGALLPRSSHGNIIITSRNEALSLLTEKSQKLVDLETEDAIQLLLKHAIKPPDMVSMADKQNAAEIVRELYYFPLAIAQAGAYICQEKCLGNYVDQLHKQKGLLNKTVPQVVDVYSLTVYSTWDLSWEKLDESTKSFLRVCSQLHYEQIPTLLFERAEKNLETFGVRFEPSQAVSAAKQFFNETQLRPWGNERFEQIITQLRSYSLLSVHEQGIYSIHPLVHYWIEDNLDLENQIYSKLQAQGILAAGIWNMTSWRDQRFAKMAALHAILKNLFYNGEYPIQVAGRELFFQTSNFKEALKLAKCLVLETNKQYGLEHRETFNNLEYLGVVYHRLGKNNDALKLEEPLFKISSRVLGAEHSDTLRRMYNLSACYSHLGRYHDALKLAEHLVQMCSMVFGAEHLDTLRSLHNLSVSYSCLGRYNDVLELAEPLVKISSMVLGAEHPDTLRWIQNLSSSYSNLGRYNDALNLAQPLVEICTRLFGAEHPDTLSCMHNLSSSYGTLGRYNDALKLAEPLVEISSRLFGVEHPDTLSCIYNLSSCYSILGRYNDALKLAEPCVEVSCRVLGAKHPDTLNQMQTLCFTYRKLGRYSDSLKILHPLVTISAKVLGAEHPRTLNRMQNLGFTYSNLEKYENALKLLHPLVKIFTRVLGAEHPNTLDAIQDLAWTYAQSSNYCKALDLQAPLLPVYQQKMGQEHPLTLQVAHDLSETFFYLGRHNDALNLQRPLFETSQAILGANHPDTISKMFILARTLYCSSGSTEALQLVKSAIEKSKHILGDGHPETLKRVQYLNILHIQLESTPEGNQGKRKDRLIEKFRYYLTKGHPKVK